jgi:Phosphotransferase enzyme family
VTGWPRTKTEDGAALVAAVKAATGLGLEYIGRLPGGNAGAALARLGGGERVLTSWDGARLGRWPELAPVLDRLRSAGYPIPRMEVVTLPGGGAATLQERVPGVPAAYPTAGLVVDLCRLVEQQADQAPAPGRTELYLDRDGPGFCLHGPPRAYSHRTRELLDWVESVRGACAGRDLLHLDLHLGNVLVDPDDPDRVVGVVDWTGPAYGDRRFDLVTLGFDLTWHGESETAVLDRIGDPAAVRPYAAHMALRLVDWTIRHNVPADVDRWLTVASRWRTLTR